MEKDALSDVIFLNNPDIVKNVVRYTVQVKHIFVFIYIRFGFLNEDLIYFEMVDTSQHFLKIKISKEVNFYSYLHSNILSFQLKFFQI